VSPLAVLQAVEKAVDVVEAISSWLPDDVRAPVQGTISELRSHLTAAAVKRQDERSEAEFKDELEKQP